MPKCKKCSNGGSAGYALDFDEDEQLDFDEGEQLDFDEGELGLDIDFEDFDEDELGLDIDDFDFEDIDEESIGMMANPCPSTMPGLGQTCWGGAACNYGQTYCNGQMHFTWRATCENGYWSMMELKPCRGPSPHGQCPPQMPGLGTHCWNHGAQCNYGGQGWCKTESWKAQCNGGFWMMQQLSWCQNNNYPGPFVGGRRLEALEKIRSIEA